MEMLKDKFTIGLIAMVLLVALIGGLEQKKTAETGTSYGQQISDLYIK